ncbi:lactonase family protein [Aquimarina agarivorans]|uniref:lactonase family protein n=1 Tax=Aquimarina agarivorans TaxID=980584 RepID=UPI000248E5A6|nr:lactonase family protein [Aquimarina agarivorans]
MKKIYNSILGVLLTLIIFQMNAQESTAHEFYVGTLTFEGDSKGIYKYTLDSNGKFKSLGLVAETDSPSYLALTEDKKILVSANMDKNWGNGKVTSFSVADKGLVAISESQTDKIPCHVSIKNKYVLISNYGGGNTELFKLDASGKLSELLSKEQHEGTGTHERQEAPHAHSAWFKPNSNEIVSVDLGTNHLWFSELNETKKALEPSKPKNFAMATGAGPRHLAFHPLKPQFIYVLNELDNTVTLVENNKSNSYKVLSSISTLPKDFSGKNTAADIHISKDGKFLYTSNRGDNNSLAIFKINETTGILSLVGIEPTKGEVPRNFAISPTEDFIVVANKKTNNLVSFKRDKVTGKLLFTDEITAPTPTCVLFYN